MTTGFVACVRSPRADAASEGGNNQRRISIAVPDFTGDSASADVSPRDFSEIVISDLKASGRFAFVEPDSSIEEKIDTAPQFGRWQALHTDGLVIGHISRKPDQRLFVEFRLWDVAMGQQLVGAQYILQPEDWRRVPHLIADAVIERLIGRI
jgi:TolB protein